LINQSVEKVVFLVVGSNTPRSGFVAAVSRLVARGLRHVDVSGDDPSRASETADTISSGTSPPIWSP